MEVLKKVDLILERSISLSIRGDSGCGKTTLLNLLARLETADCGKVYWGDLEMDASSKSSDREIRIRGDFLGVVYQTYYLIPDLNVMENVLLSAKLAGRMNKDTQDRARLLLSRMGVLSLENQITQKLSGGERQRVAIARALINRPQVVFADEPTGNLDERTGGEVMELLLDVCRSENSSLILVTHNPKFAESTNRSVFLKDGTLHSI